MITEAFMDRTLPVVADSWPQLRRIDVERLLNHIKHDNKESLLTAAGIVVAKRPELQKHVDQAVEWISSEYGWDNTNL